MISEKSKKGIDTNEVICGLSSTNSSRSDTLKGKSSVASQGKPDSTRSGTAVSNEKYEEAQSNPKNVKSKGSVIQPYSIEMNGIESAG